ncbi:Selenium-binding protein 1 [Aphelenchoides fujianensis]|nr:Selenium-binding protein 1 [Aphelenchoides fujianensis]
METQLTNFTAKCSNVIHFALDPSGDLLYVMRDSNFQRIDLKTKKIFALPGRNDFEAIVFGANGDVFVTNDDRQLVRGVFNPNAGTTPAFESTTKGADGCNSTPVIEMPGEKKRTISGGDTRLPLQPLIREQRAAIRGVDESTAALLANTLAVNVQRTRSRSRSRAPSPRPPAPGAHPSERPASTESGIAYKTPADATQGPREKLMFVTATNYTRRGPFKRPPSKKSDAVFTIDIDPASATYCKPVSKVVLPKIGDEVHHSGWNACASFLGKTGVLRRFLICPTLFSSRVYVIDTLDPLNLKLHHTVYHEEMAPLDATFLYSTHCLPTGEIMISSLGDNSGKNKYVMLDKDFKVKGVWSSKSTTFGCGFWYQPRKNVMISTEWGAPSAIKHGFDPKQIEKGYYSRRLNIWDWEKRTRIQSIELKGEESLMGFEIRMLHDPEKEDCFFGAARGSALYHLFKPEGSTRYVYRVAARHPKVKVAGWKEPEMPGLLSDNIISMDDKFLYASLWLHGEVLQYDIRDPRNIKLVGRVKIGGLLHNQSGYKVEEPGWVGYDQTEVKGRKIHGGPCMMQLSLDGKRLYISTSLVTSWDADFYPDLVKHGGVMLMCLVNTETGGLELDPNFLVDFGTFEDVPYGPHEMRYPGGDVTSDIWM